MKKEFIGIDVSKKTLDAHLYYSNAHCRFKNTIEGRQELMDWTIEATGLDSTELRFCLEHTGIYSQPLCEFLEQVNVA